MLAQEGNGESEVKGKVVEVQVQAAGDADLVRAEATEQRLLETLSPQRNTYSPPHQSDTQTPLPASNKPPTKSLAGSVFHHRTSASPPPLPLPPPPAGATTSHCPAVRLTARFFHHQPLHPRYIPLIARQRRERARSNQSPWRASTPTSTSRCPGHTGTMTASTSAGESWRTTRSCAK
jgi:hypothetical protein